MTAPVCPVCGRPVLRPQAITCTVICASKRRVAMRHDYEKASVVALVPDGKRNLQRIKKNEQDREKWHERRRFLEQGAVLFAKGRT